MIRQVVRVVALGVTGALCFVLDTSTGSDTSTYKLVHFLQRFTFTSWFGASIWVSFVAGLVMFRNMKRHDFGRLQSKLFPAYFEYSALMLTLSCAATYAMGPSVYEKQIMPLGSCLGLILINLLYLEPKTTAIMFKRHTLERELGTGHEVGRLKPDSAKARENKELQAISKKFGMYHGMSSTVNLAALCVGVYHLYSTL